jgi:hypothetical protein
MNLQEALQGEMDRLWADTEVRSPITGNRGRKDRMRAIERAHRGPAGAAAAVGVSRETWRRWGKTGGQSPSAANLRRLQDTYETASRPARLRALKARLRRSAPVVTAVVRWSNSKPYNREPHRTVRLKPIPLDGLVGPWDLGDGPMLAETLEQTVVAAYPDSHAGEIRFEGDAVTVEL